MTRAPKPRRGRPPGTGRGNSDVLRIRVTAEEKAAYERAARQATVSDWARQTLNQAVRNPAGPCAGWPAG